MSKHSVAGLSSLFFLVLLITSCAAPTYLPKPTVNYPGIMNTCTFGVQNMDELAKIEPNMLTAHYDGFDVTYKINNDFVVSLIISNNSNKSLIIDKSKCYVLYNGYSTDLFKDVRSSRSTTFNNVQDAINNVQTHEGGVSMTVPPYSKWELPLQESNVRQLNQLPDFNSSVGVHPLSPFENKEIVEFIIPYSFDYSMAKWDTSRNRIYVNSIDTKEFSETWPFTADGAPKMIAANQYEMIRANGVPDFSEVRKTNAINMKIYKKHKKAVSISHGVWGTALLPVGFIGWHFYFRGCDHEPPVYETTWTY